MIFFRSSGMAHALRIVWITLHHLGLSASCLDSLLGRSGESRSLDSELLGQLAAAQNLVAVAALGEDTLLQQRVDLSLIHIYITDPVADMLTRIRNANNAKHDTVDVPASNMKKSIAQILLDEGYIKNFQVVDDGTQGVIHISLKYNAGKEKVISGLRRVSKPGLRVYVGADELPRVLRGLGIAIISTSKGVMTDKKARELHVGGEVLAFVW